MRRAASALLLAALLPPGAARAEPERRFFAMASDFAQVLHQCFWAGQVNVDGRRPLVPLVLALDEQSRNLNEARLLLLPHSDEPVPDARRAVQALLSGIGMFSLCVSADLADINTMNDRWELSQRLEGRRADRREATEVMAGSVGFLREALFEQVPDPVHKGEFKPSPRLFAEESASLWKQLNILFGKDLGGGGAETSPLLAAVEELMKTLRASKPSPDAPAAATAPGKKPLTGSVIQPKNRIESGKRQRERHP